MISPNKDSDDNLFTFGGFNNYTISNMKFYKSKRSCLYIQYCGVGTIENCTFKDYGYVTKDQGYNNSSSSPEGLSFGYGIITTRSYFTNVVNCRSFSGWHGYEVSWGQTFAVFDNCSSLKDAYGFSTHEGVWDVRIKNCNIEGGAGITCRGFNLTILNSIIKANVGHAISAPTHMQKLIIKNNLIETKSSAIYCSGARDESLFNYEKLVCIIDGNDFTSGVETRIITLSEIDFINNNLKCNQTSSTTSASYILSPTSSSTPEKVIKRVNIINNISHHFTGQNVYMTNGDILFAKNNYHTGSFGTYSNSGLFYNKCTTSYFINNTSLSSMCLVRQMGSNTTTIELLKDNFLRASYLVLGDASLVTVKNAINNVSSSTTIFYGGSVANVVNHSKI